MAEAILSAILGDFVSRAISLLIGRYTSGKESTEGKLQKISHLLIRIHSVVEEAKARHISNHGNLQWLSELIDSEYQGCYLLDSIGYYGGKEEVDELCDDDKVAPPQVSTLSLFNPAKRARVDGGTMRRRSNKFSWCHDVDADEIDRVLERLQGVSHDLREFIMLLQNCKPIRRPLATNIFREGQMFGRHVEKERIINFLLHEGEQSAAEELGMLPIVGASGIGKTTLVQHACDDARVRSHFAVIILCNSTCIYDVKNNQRTLIRTFIDSLEFVKGDSFRDKRCLFVFEDVDMHRKHILEELLQILRRCCKEESKVIITTNNRRVANIGTVEPIILRVLLYAEYWFFFKAHVFTGRDTEDNPSLVSAAMGIARKLNGSFFGAKIIGGVLRDRPDPNLWCKILRSNIGGMRPIGDCIIYISDLAHNLLPGHVDMWTVTCSKDPFPSQTAEVPWLKDLCGAVPHDSMTACWADEGRYTNVLLCKSVMPFRNPRYYVACCTCTCSSTIGPTNSCSELVLSLVRDM